VSEDERGEGLDDATLAKVESVLREASGLTLAASVRRSLSTALQRAAESRKMELPAFLEKLLAKEQSVVASFVEYAVIGETYFFRHPEHLRELSREAVMSTGPFKVWSAGCATGEEPYSIVMSLVAAGIPVERIKVTATDISTRALQRARAATYNSWSVRRIEPAMERRFLAVQNEVVTVSPQVAKSVEFQQHNLMMDSAPVSDQDAVFCRNVLIYFPQEVVRLVLVKLIGALKPGGLLFLAPAEVPLTNEMGLEVIEIQNTPILRVPRKGAGEAKASRRPKLDLARKMMTMPLVPSVPPPANPPPLAVAPSPGAPHAQGLASLGTPQSANAATPARAAMAVRSSGLAVRPTPAPVRFTVSAVAAPAAAPKPAEVVAPPAPPAPPPAALTPDDMVRQALAAAQEGKYDQAEVMAKEAARKLVPKAYMVLAMVAEAKGDLNGAVDAVRKALYLDPKLALSHAKLMTLYSNLERREDAERARRNALSAIEGLDDDHMLHGVETSMTVGVLRQALKDRGRA
jgi:chemotaxis protein methyltransferase CheR